MLILMQHHVIRHINNDYRVRISYNICVDGYNDNQPEFVTYTIAVSIAEVRFEFIILCSHVTCSYTHNYNHPQLVVM